MSMVTPATWVTSPASFMIGMFQLSQWTPWTWLTRWEGTPFSDLVTGSEISAG